MADLLASTSASGAQARIKCNTLNFNGCRNNGPRCIWKHNQKRCVKKALPCGRFLRRWDCMTRKGRCKWVRPAFNARPGARAKCKPRFPTNTDALDSEDAFSESEDFEDEDMDMEEFDSDSEDLASEDFADDNADDEDIDLYYYRQI